MSEGAVNIDTQLATECPFWTASDWAAFRSMDAAGQQLVATALDQSAKRPGVNGWMRALSVFEAFATDSAEIVGFASTLATIRQLAKTL